MTLAACAGADPGAVEARRAEGGVLFAERCGTCHVETEAARRSRRVGRPAPPSVLAQLPPEAIIVSLTTGKMKTHGERLTPRQREDIALHLSGRLPGTSGADANSP